MIFFNKCCLNIVLFSLIFCNCYIIVFSLVDFKPRGRGFKSRLCQTFFFFFFFTFFFSFSFFKYKESVLGSNIAPPPPPHTFFHFLNIVQYLLVHCTIPSILGSHPPYPTSPPTPNIAFTSTLTPAPPTPPPPNPLRYRPPPPDPPPNFFFLNFHKNFNSSFISTLTPPQTRPLPLTPQPPRLPPQKKKNFFFEFSQKLQFFVHIHPDPSPARSPPPRPTPPQKIFFYFFCIFTKTSILRSHPP